MAAGVVVAIASVVAAVRVPAPIPTGANETLSTGVLPIDATIISDAPSWHAAEPSEMDAGGIEVLRSFGIAATGRVPGDFSGSGTGQDAAYLLINGEGKRRVVIVGGHQNRYDARFHAIALIARVPKDSVSSIHWKGDKAPAGMLGDGLLIVRDASNVDSGVVVFLTADAITSYSPKSWQDVQLK